MKKTMPRALLAGGLAAVMCLAASPSAADQVPSGDTGVLYAPQGAPDPNRPFVRLAVNRFSMPNRNAPVIQRTVETFARVFGKGNFEARILTNVDSIREKPELILGSAGTSTRYRKDGSRNLATLMSPDFPDPNHGEGSLFIALKSSGIRSFEDMKGKRAVLLGPNAFTGNTTAMGEILRRGSDPDRFFSQVLYANASMPRELTCLRSGEADVAVVRTCFLEDMARSGENVADIAPVAVRNDVRGACLSSTSLYPNWTIFATPQASPEVARLAAAALLQLPPDKDGLRWGIASDFSSVDKLYHSLRRGPYEYLRTWSWVRFWEEYWQWFALAGLAMLMLVLHSLRSSHLVQVRTRQLQSVMESLIQTESKAKEAVARIEAMQKVGVIGQMSSIIAHELRQPLSSIAGYIQGLSRLLDREEPIDREIFSQGLDHMRRQAQKADEIVRKVRAYAKRPASERKQIDLVETLRQAASTVFSTGRYSASLQDRLPADQVRMQADPLEIEIIFVNLIKNACEAQAGLDSPFVRLELAREDPGCVAVRVSDNGPRLDDEQFKALAQPLVSSKIDGLGLGTSIVKMIVESYGGHLAYRRLDPRGLMAEIKFPLQEGDK